MRRLHLITPLLLGMALAVPGPTAHAQVAVGLSITIAPPALPIYVQPPIPAPGYLWTPGYWAYGSDGYYWVPGTWVQPPSVGLLWTPGYWGWNAGVYAFNAGYWGPQVGFYGGINYGFGYSGVGYGGGYWNNNRFFYNRSVNNFGGVHITNVYNRTVVMNERNRASFNGPGGATARPTAAQLAFARSSHVGPTEAQRQNAQMAAADPRFRAGANHGVPPVAATSHAGTFQGAGVVASTRGGSAKPFQEHGAAGANVNAQAGPKKGPDAHQQALAKAGPAAGRTPATVGHSAAEQRALARAGTENAHDRASAEHANAQASLSRQRANAHAQYSMSHSQNARQSNFARNEAGTGHANAHVWRNTPSRTTYAHAGAGHAGGGFAHAQHQTSFAARGGGGHAGGQFAHAPRQTSFAARGGAGGGHAAAGGHAGGGGGGRTFAAHGGGGAAHAPQRHQG
jgi:hypothetical protein